jgi:hypothetical protein
MPKVAREINQPNLFDPNPQHPRWEDLPLDVRCQATRLLAELLSRKVAQTLQTSKAEGGSDE